MIATALIALLPGLAYATSMETAIPYASFQPKIDGELSEWRAPVLKMGIDESLAPPAQRNQLRVQLAWTADALLMAGEMLDTDLIVAPAQILVEQFCQYDALQLYIDPQHDSHTRMNGDDIDLIMLPDGRSGVLRGDDLIATLMHAQVPQRQSVPLARQYATQRQQHGWTFELSIPLAALGKSFSDKMPDAMRALKLDLAMHDLTENHAPLDETSFSAAEIEAQRKSPSLALIENSPQAQRRSRRLWSLSWTGERDLGYPSNWRNMLLQGDVPISERVLRRFGATRIAVVSIVLLMLMTLASMLLTEWHARARLRRVLIRLRQAPAGAMTEILPEADSAQEPEVLSEVEPQTQSSAAQVASGVDPRHRAFAERTLNHVRNNLHADLSPEALAAVMHTSLRSLQRKLRSGMNSTPQDLVLAARLEAAHAMLSEGALRVSEVAFQVGFDDLSHFSRRFRSAYGVTPSQLSAGAR